MTLAVNRSGTIFKKCGKANHRPDSNQGCASTACELVKLPQQGVKLIESRLGRRHDP
jgi:hypothetical protein